MVWSQIKNIAVVEFSPCLFLPLPGFASGNALVCCKNYVLKTGDLLQGFSFGTFLLYVHLNVIPAICVISISFIGEFWPRIQPVHFVCLFSSGASRQLESHARALVVARLPQAH